VALTIIVVRKDRADLYQNNMDFTEMEGVAPDKFITIHRNGIDSVTESDERHILVALITPLTDQLAERRSMTFIPYSYLRNAPIELIGYEKRLFSTFEDCTYRYLPSLELLKRPPSMVARKRSCIALAFGSVDNLVLSVEEEIASRVDDARSLPSTRSLLTLISGCVSGQASVRYIEARSLD
jgi:hypothetical protein